ncbi:MAG: hypothetical protein MJA30_12645 [Cytophagales bacterium]|nr:hypothetical protein [Cytophagales bacterium]
MEHLEIILYLIIGILYFLLNRAKRKSKKFSSAENAEGEEDFSTETGPPQAKPILSWEDLFEEFESQASEQRTPEKVVSPGDNAVLVKTEVHKKDTHATVPRKSVGETPGHLLERTATSSPTSTKHGPSKSSATETKLDRLLRRYDGLKKAVVMSELLHRNADFSPPAYLPAR